MSWSDWKQVEGDGMSFEEIIYEKKFHAELEGGIARISINKPKKYNTMTMVTVDEMFRAFYDANHDAEVGVIIVAAIGKHFGVGGDVEWEKWGLREAFYNRYPHTRLIRLSRKPVIAAVNGPAFGGGIGLVAAADIVVAARDTKFGLLAHVSETLVEAGYRNVSRFSWSDTARGLVRLYRTAGDA